MEQEADLSIHMEHFVSPFLLASAGDLTQLKVTELHVNEADRDGCTLLHHAARNGHIPVIQYLIERGVSMDTTNREGNSALHLAVMRGQTEAMNLLLAHGVDDAILNLEQDAPLHIAVRDGNVDLLRAFLSHPEVDLLLGDCTRKQTVLHMVAESGLVEAAQTIMKSKPFAKIAHQGLSDSCIDENGLTPLHLAIRKGSHQVLDVMLNACKSYGLSTEHILDDSNDFPLLAAVDSGNIEVVKVLLRHGASPLEVKLEQPPPLHLACFMGHLDIVKSMVEHCGREVLNHRDVFGKTPLHYVASALGCDMLSYILDQGDVMLDITDALGQTPLHLAVLTGNLKGVKLLIDSKADPLLRDNQLLNVIHFAVVNNQLEVLKYLLPKVPELMKEVDKMGYSPFHLAIKNSASDLCYVMLEYATVGDVKDSDGNQYLHLVATTGNKALLKKLLNSTPYLNTLNKGNRFGETPLHLAAEGGHSECVKLLLNCGAHPHWCHRNNMTAFFHTCSHGHVACARAILDQFPFQGDWVNDKGNTALHYAAISGSPEMVSFLLDRGCKISLSSCSQSFLEVAVDMGHFDVVRAALGHDRWQECLDCNSAMRPHPMLQLVRSMPEAAQLVLNRCHEKAAMHKLHPDYWEKFNFKYVQLKSSSNEDTNVAAKHRLPHKLPKSAEGGLHERVSKWRMQYRKWKKWKLCETVRVVSEMVHHEEADLLSHPVVNMYMHLKWNRYGFWLYSFFFVVRVILAMLISTYTTLIIRPGQLSSASGSLINSTNTSTLTNQVTTVSAVAQVIRAVALVINFFTTLHLSVPIFSSGWCIFNVVDKVELWTYVFASFSNFLFLLIPNPSTIPSAGALACFFSWLMVLVALGSFDLLGIYVNMFIWVTRTVVLVMTLCIILILAFSFAFYALANTVPEFSTVEYSFLSLFFTMLGDFQHSQLISMDIDGVFINREIVFFFLFVAAILLSIIMANLLIGLAVGDIEKIKKNASFEKKKILLKFFNHADKLFLSKRYHNIMFHVVYPNAKVSKIRQIWRHTWKAAKKDTSEEGGNSLHRTSANDDKLDHIIDRLDKLTATVKHLQEHFHC